MKGEPLLLVAIRHCCVGVLQTGELLDTTTRRQIARPVKQNRALLVPLG